MKGDSMTHENIEIVKKSLGAFQAGDLDTVRESFADDIVWHIPGKSPMSGDYKGKEEVLGFLGRTVEMTGGTFKVEPHDILASDEHVVILARQTAEREGKRLDAQLANVIHIRDGKVAEFWGHPFDLYAGDEFWS